jgi:hypothetical protein
MRCAEKGRRSECNGCSGRLDITGQRIPHSDDYCQCSEGIMRWMTKEGQLAVRRYQSSPFKAEVKIDAVSEDERDWNNYLQERKEFLNDPEYDPFKMYEED